MKDQTSEIQLIIKVKDISKVYIVWQREVKESQLYNQTVHRDDGLIM